MWVFFWCVFIIENTLLTLGADTQGKVDCFFISFSILLLFQSSKITVEGGLLGGFLKRQTLQRHFGSHLNSIHGTQTDTDRHARTHKKKKKNNSQDHSRTLVRVYQIPQRGHSRPGHLGGKGRGDQ